MCGLADLSNCTIRHGCYSAFLTVSTQREKDSFSCELRLSTPRRLVSRAAGWQNETKIRPLPWLGWHLTGRLEIKRRKNVAVLCVCFVEFFCSSRDATVGVLQRTLRFHYAPDFGDSNFREELEKHPQSAATIVWQFNSRRAATCQANHGSGWVCCAFLPGRPTRKL